MDKKEIEKLLSTDLFKELNLEDIEPEIKQTILDDAGYVITRGIWIKIIESLSEEKQNELANILKNDSENAEAIANFIKKEIPNYEDLAKEEVANYKSMLLAKVK
ncbi:MAG: hypothetical protein UR25_C0003G0171 [Candidatus Nomurabacteria bacterium GW2011_GWE1_32_28]|uniref:Uncharacterized protein n=1 Tax=Candidatus Nomurabacteria bacterium GW2011_GWF1_31_48 TaxID=1618767 RepID=A0A0F9YG31_9BACT|nr:MAG: hypothetical protein UR10_C0003G0170 [Candidatus Nomurabacteria bacterium GW2011_GWF2_30_133]KKP28810.1 MAG: hypothetical protein UR18_C0002G0222 [Candidatus Nomurabacteria bacterium GW2011_GWE2_31_40]KKP30388.1 MAG: hypothetical protein UR19_C0003G0224 [Candidatus Nomurabacteria bacterium GW2011_GWF1_31_48]KKP34915.1 MAG: hypothetical protein UR25_C0003G0171 [Candidatus Nomurabacteria bacterium GW2011_GWE1_32_28]HAS81006.1 hypothetical protein [Candidatus Nomurabacteria bacterium]